MINYLNEFIMKVNVEMNYFVEIIENFVLGKIIYNVMLISGGN